MNATEERAEQQLTVNAPAAHCYAVATDFEAYPDWSQDVEKISVAETDSEGRAKIVEFQVQAMGRTSRYSLEYNYDRAPHILSWQLVEGDIEKALNGEYQFDADGDRTRVTYRLSVELKVGMPGFVRRRAEGRILDSALRSLKARAEA